MTCHGWPLWSRPCDNGNAVYLVPSWVSVEPVYVLVPPGPPVIIVVVTVYPWALSLPGKYKHIAWSSLRPKEIVADLQTAFSNSISCTKPKISLKFVPNGKQAIFPCVQSSCLEMLVCVLIYHGISPWYFVKCAVSLKMSERLLFNNTYLFFYR